MKFSLRTLFVLTAAVALGTWLVTNETGGAIAIALGLLWWRYGKLAADWLSRTFRSLRASARKRP